MKTVIYLTGPPGIGKTTLAEGLAASVNADVISYGRLLLKSHDVADHEELREKSSAVITSNSVSDLDRAIRDRVIESAQPVVVIDSHAVTREFYGFRTIPYDVPTLRSLGLTAIVCLIATPETIRARLDSDRAGRQIGTPFHISMHTDLQSSLALTYSHSAGVPVHFIDASGTPAEVLKLVTAACSFVKSPR